MIPTSASLCFPSNPQCAANCILKLPLEGLNYSAWCLCLLVSKHSFRFHHILGSKPEKVLNCVWPLLFVFLEGFQATHNHCPLKEVYVDVYFWPGRKEPIQVSEEIKKAEGKWLGKLLTSCTQWQLHIVYACKVPLENGMMVHCSNSSTWEDGVGTSLTGGHLELHNKTLFQTLKTVFENAQEHGVFYF